MSEGESRLEIRSKAWSKGCRSEVEREVKWIARCECSSEVESEM